MVKVNKFPFKYNTSVDFEFTHISPGIVDK